MEAALATLPMLDIHTHLVGGRLGARGLHDVLLYHMVVSDLYSAGCPTGGRSRNFPIGHLKRKRTAGSRGTPFSPTNSQHKLVVGRRA